MLYGLLMGAMFFVALWIAALAQGQTEFTSLSAVKGSCNVSAALSEDIWASPSVNAAAASIEKARP